MEKRFIVTPKEEDSVTVTVRLKAEISAHLDTLSIQSRRSRNELINMALAFALENLEFIDA